jgi:putative component of toxin-antitoxin plasmid stabilization module
VKGDELILLLAGGDTSTQAHDIETTLALSKDWKQAQQ